MAESPGAQQQAEEIACFAACELVDAMKAEGLDLQVVQTGGGTATFFLQAEGSHTFLIGPGSHNWTNPLESEFTTAGLYYGPDEYDDDGEPVEFPDDEQKTIEPGMLMADVAQEIAANFRRFNNRTADSAT